MKIMVDIDNTICNTFGNDYMNAKPIHENIKKINNLHKAGHTIIYWTARGRTTHMDWHYLTRKQLDDWGCKYDELDTLTKPAFDLLIDDKSVNIENV